jgi:uncharacterized repeat protein (TIGR03803 family)
MSGVTARFNSKILLRTIVPAFAVLVFLAGTVSPPRASAQAFKVLYSFQGSPDGGNPYGTLILDSAGNLYGTTTYGGKFACAGGGCGVAFEVSGAGREAVLHNFNNGGSGARPIAGLTADAQGNLYGVTGVGGDLGCPEGFGCGTVYEIHRSGGYSILYALAGRHDAARSDASLLRDSDGTLYGTSYYGGGRGCGGSGCGTVFKVDSAGNETVLHRFSGGLDGGWPVAGLARDADGNLYGATEVGGTGSECGSLGCGVVFKVTTDGQLFSVVYRFTGGSDGSEPTGTLARDSAGTLYGTTGLGGDLTCSAPAGCGVVFKIESSGVETVLHAFEGGISDGSDPIAGVILDPAGNLFGTTYRDGANGFGTVFELDANGSESILHSFTNGADGSFPYAGLARDSSGNLYGTAAYGGTSGCGGEGCGTVFKITP